MDINFNCPEFYYGIDIYDRLFELQELEPEAFYPEAKVKYVYGALPGMIWNGGGFMDGRPEHNIEYLCAMRDFYEKNNIILRFTLTNPNLEETDVYDRQCNEMLKLFDNGVNEIIVNSPILERYLRDKFPNYKLTKSITAAKEDYDYVKALDIYESVVIPRRKNRDWEFLNSIPEDKRSRIEILADETCPIDCPRLYTHYNVFSKMNLFQTFTENERNCTTAKNNSSMFPEINNKDVIYMDEIIDKYLPLGFNNVKISGRNAADHCAKGLAQYFFKPEYKLAGFCYILNVGRN